MNKLSLAKMSSLALDKLKTKTPVAKLQEPKKNVDRFGGLSVEEVQKRTLSDYLETNLDMVFVGINPSLMAACRGRYYAGPGNHFYKLLHESGLVPRYVSFEEDYKLLQYGIGLTNIVARATRSSADLKRAEIEEGAKIVREKLQLFKPRVAVFNGKCIYEVFANKTGNFHLGLQPQRVGETAIWVTPSSSARCANFPRMVDKLQFYTALKKYLQFLKGEIKEVNVKEFWFKGKCEQAVASTSIMWRRKNLSSFLYGGRVVNRNVVGLDTSIEDPAVVQSTQTTPNKAKTNDSETSEISAAELRGTEMVEASASNEVLESRETSTFEQKENMETSNLRTPDNEENVASQNTAMSMVRLSDRRKKIKRLSPKPIRVTSYLERKDSPEFVSLIKRRLQKKAENANGSDEQTKAEEERTMRSNNTRKVKKIDKEKKGVNMYETSTNNR